MKFEITLALLSTLCSFVSPLYFPNVSSAFLPLYIAMPEDDVACVLPPDPGMCRAAQQKYFYNSTSGGCDAFLYGGCGGNENKFDTEKECLRRCQGYNANRYIM